MRWSKSQFLSVIFLIFCTISILLSCTDDSNQSEAGPVPLLPRFENVISEVGIPRLGISGQTAAWGDFNNDGCQDLFVGTTDLAPPNVFLLRNNCDGTFVDVTSGSGILDAEMRSVSWADFDNDGLLDLVVSTIVSVDPPILYRNLDGNSFLDVSNEAGITGGGVIGHTVWGDCDGDGFVDLFQANSGISFLYRNKGDGSFMEVSQDAGLGQFLNTNSAVWFDVNNDGFQDLFLANIGFNSLYLNNGDCTFTDVSNGAGVQGNIDWDSDSACAGDFNNDGFLDLYVGNIESSRNALYRNNGDGTFSDITLETGTGDIGDARTCAWVDFDGDGLLDLFTTNHLNPTKFFRNLGNARFIDAAVEVGVDFPIDVFVATWGDYNNDTFMDVFLDGHLGTALMENGGNTNNNLIIELVGDGVSSNSSAIGTRVELLTSRGTQIREVSGGRGCCEQDMLPIHFGVGNDNQVDISVDWLGGGGCFFQDIDVEGGRFFIIFQDGCDILLR